MTFEDKVNRFYNFRVDYDNIVTVSRATTMVNLLPPKRGGSIVDLATGTGDSAFRAAELVGSDGVFRVQSVQGVWSKLDRGSGQREPDDVQCGSIRD